MKYEVLSIEDFGRQLLFAGDLDPVYNAVHAAEMSPDQLRRWLLAYWCCYNAGLASWLSEQTSDAFWGGMFRFAYNDTESPAGGRWPRGRERRHFRGANAVSAVEYFHGHFSTPEMPVSLLQHLPRSADGFVPYKTIRNAVTVWPQFGPWIAFKVGDMLERCAGVPVNFSDAEVFFFEQPTEAAHLWFKTHHKVETSPHGAPVFACEYLASKLGGMLAPPTNNRVLNNQEYETILCKWKSHVNGNYPIGIDKRELHEALHHWSAVSATAKRMRGSISL